MSRDRILHIIPKLDCGGTDKQVTLLAAKLPSDEFDVHVCTLAQHGGRLEQLRHTGIPVVALDQHWRADPFVFARLVRHIQRLRPAIVHAWQFSAGLYGRAAAKLAGVKQLIVGHRSAEKGKTAWQWAAEQQMARFTARLVFNSHALQEHYRQHGLPAERCAVIASGVGPAPDSDVSREQLLRELKLPGDARLIGAIGRLTASNRTTDLIWAADLIRVLHDNMRLLVIGDGPQRPQLERFARLASDLDHIRFLGQRADLWRILPHLDTLWQGSSTERHPHSVLEAMSAGVPVVASDIKSHRELIVDGESGFLVPVAARAARVRITDRIFQDAELATRVGKSARRRVGECFNVESAILRYTELYRELLAN